MANVIAGLKHIVGHVDMIWTPTLSSVYRNTYDPDTWKVLNDAADIIARHGHTKHALRDFEGYCAFGAIIEAAERLANGYEPRRQRLTGTAADAAMRYLRT